ncbi:MAG: hypothetical protein KF812_12640 [Fimbriimonadaceae bacterium]|nr:hypothetical protein [Fimbriimonadaceae bacterium]
MIPLALGLLQSDSASDVIARYAAWREAHPMWVAEYRLTINNDPATTASGLFLAGGNLEQYFTVLGGPQRWRYSQVGSRSILISDMTKEYDFMTGFSEWSSPEMLTDLMQLSYPAGLIPGRFGGQGQNWKFGARESVGTLAAVRLDLDRT